MSNDASNRPPVIGIKSQSLELQKASLFQQKFTNLQLAALNVTNADIAASNRRIERIQRDALDQTKRQTAILELQLEESKLVKLEAHRQHQLKQSAFTLTKDIDTTNTFKPFPKVVWLRQLSAEVASVNLNPAELHEINDKEYAHSALTKLQESTAKAEKELTAFDLTKLETFFTSMRSANALAGALYKKQRETVQKKNELVQLREVLTTTQNKEYGTGKQITKVIGRLIGLVLFLIVILIIIGVIAPTDDKKQDQVVYIAAVVFGILFSILGAFCFFAVGLPNKKRIAKLHTRIDGCEGSIKTLLIEHQDINIRLEASYRLVSELANEYPELNNLVATVIKPPVIRQIR
jgi:hypothetical protein